MYLFFAWHRTKSCYLYPHTPWVFSQLSHMTFSHTSYVSCWCKQVILINPSDCWGLQLGSLVLWLFLFQVSDPSMSIYVCPTALISITIHASNSHLAGVLLRTLGGAASSVNFDRMSSSSEQACLLKWWPCTKQALYLLDTLMCTMIYSLYIYTV